MNDKDSRTVSKMIEYCDNVASFLDGLDDNFEAYRVDVRTRYACDMCVIRMGELVGRLSDELKARRPSVPWAQIRAASEYLTRDYDAAEPELIWETLRQDVPALRGVLLEILAENELDAG